MQWFVDTGNGSAPVRQNFSQTVIQHSSNQGQDLITSQLTTEGLMLSDQGLYFCRASNTLTYAGEFSADSNAVKLIIYRKVALCCSCAACCVACFLACCVACHVACCVAVLHVVWHVK